MLTLLLNFVKMTVTIFQFLYYVVGMLFLHERGIYTEKSDVTN